MVQDDTSAGPWSPDPSALAGTPLGLYVHVPFCERRCGYCAFSTVAVGAELDRTVAERFVASLEQELELVARVLGPRRPALSSIYLGGGTPTMLAPSSVGRLLDAVRDRVGVDERTVVEMEANPDGLAPGQLAELRALGVTRISFGLQSIRPRVLELLDRTHDPRRALDAVVDAHRAGIDHVGVDLIHGTPGERPADWDATLRAAADSGVDHVSAYALSVEPGTKLAARVRSGELAAPDRDEAAERYLVAEQRLSAAGFEWYELSNWAREPGARSTHNQLYWRNHHWWGVGPSAHSHVDGRRWWNLEQLGPWSQALAAGVAPEAGHELTTPDQRVVEAVMLGLRLAEGIPPDLVPHRPAVAELVADGLVTADRDRVVLTLEGRLLADLVVRRLV